MDFPPLPPPYDQALRAAVAHIEERIDALGIIVAGTIVQGNPHPGSDLDIFVINARPQRQRIQKRFHGVPAEIFVNPPAMIRRYFEQERERPSTAHMLANGVVLLDRDPVVAQLRAEASEWLAKPLEPSEQRLNFSRYMAADAYENAQDIQAIDAQNADMILHDAVRQMVRHAFLAANRPLPRDKQMLAALEELNPELGSHVRDFYRAESTADRFAAAALVAERTIQASGFFEWETTPEDV
jgi:predicted nucleotidyltransferase